VDCRGVGDPIDVISEPGRDVTDFFLPLASPSRAYLIELEGSSQHGRVVSSVAFRVTS
jgi:hypothetical protein